MSSPERSSQDPMRFASEPAAHASLKRWFYICLAAIALSEIVLPLLFHDGHPHFWFENIPAWGSLYGLVSCVAIIVVSKFLGKKWLMRPEDFYDR